MIMPTEKRYTDSGIEDPHSLWTEDLPPTGRKRRAYPFTRAFSPICTGVKVVDDAAICRFFNGRREQQTLPLPALPGSHGTECGFYLPTQIGYDSDHPMAEGEVGKVGVAIDSIEDMEVLSGNPLESVSTSMTINATAYILLSLYVAPGT